jgi:O-antigen/teichoic acid export membrane protein
MNTVQRIAKNTGALLLSQVVSQILGFYYIMVTARYLGAEGFGIISFALAFTGIFGVFADLGLQTLMVREVARDKNIAGKYLCNIAAIKAILAIVTFVLIAIFINLLGYPELTIKVVYMIALSVVFGSFSGMFYSIFQAFEKMEYQSVGQIISSALMLFGALFAISEGLSVVGFASIYFLVSAIVLVYSFAVFAWKFAFPKMEIDLGFWKYTMKEALPFGLTGIFVTIYYWIDSVMLSLMKGDEVVGWYNASYKLIIVLLFIPVILNTSIFPIISQFYITSKDSLRFAYEKYFKYMVIIGIPLGVGTTLLADRIILLIFGGEYMPSVIILQILIWSSVFIYLSSAFGNLLMATNRQMTLTKVTAINASANVILNLILIPKFSYIGASIATVATEFSALMFGIVLCWKIGYAIPNKEILTFGKVIAASLLMGVLIICLKSLNLFLLIFVAMVIYFAVLCLLLKVFETEDIQIFKKFAKKEL